MTEINEISSDPRVLRTRKLLQQALADLLDERDFEKISVQDIAEAATINRATFYAHYPDKFALLECVIARRFHEFLATREVQFDTTCDSALESIILAISDYLLHLHEKSVEKQIQPHIELAIIRVVKRMVLFGLKKHGSEGSVAPDMVAATVSWALYGAIKEWAQTPHRSPVVQMVRSVERLVKPIFEAA
jgi:AcrR family transcriptional regulator